MLYIVMKWLIVLIWGGEIKNLGGEIKNLGGGILSDKAYSWPDPEVGQLDKGPIPPTHSGAIRGVRNKL